MSKNQHVIEYLEYFYKKEIRIPSAILLKGNWGSGKTFFIKDYIKEKNNFIHISLYGVSKTSEIDEKIFQALHPLLSNPKFKLLGKILAGAVKIGTTIDLNGDGISDGKVVSGDVSKLDLKIFVETSENKILIFDDLERSNMKIDKLLGYINHLVEFQDQKVILVANEEKILEGDDGEKYLET